MVDPPSYNRWDLTASCLRHLSAQSVAHRVIVVENGSSDETREALRRDWPQVTALELDHNHPFTHAVNLGVAAGHGEYVVLLNNDVELRPDCLEHLVAPLEADAAVGSVASVLLQPDERAIDSVGVTTDVTLAGFPRLQGLAPEQAQDLEPLLTGPEGTAAAYRRVAWEQVGGLDESIVAYMEIVDLALRLRGAGWSSACALDAVGVHLGSATFGRRSVEQRRLAGFSRGYLLAALWRAAEPLRVARAVHRDARRRGRCAADARSRGVARTTRRLARGAGARRPLPAAGGGDRRRDLAARVVGAAARRGAPARRSVSDERSTHAHIHFPVGAGVRPQASRVRSRRSRAPACR